MTKSVIIAGNFGATNIGDEALLESLLIQIQRSSKEDLLYYILSSNPKETAERYAHTYPISTFPLFPAGPRSIVKHLWQCIRSIPILRRSSCTFFGGGGLFTDEASLFAVVMWFIQFCYLHYALGQKVHIVGQSFGPLHSSIGKTLTAFVLRRASSIYVRDVVSLDVVTTLGHTALYDPDLAFQLDPGPLVRTQPNDTLHIAVSLRPWHDNNTEKVLLDVFKDLMSEKKVLLHLVPMQYIREEDISILAAFQAKCREYNIESVLHRPATYKDVLDILETCHISLGMRLHFLIFSALVTVPCIPLSYSTKVQGVMTELGITSHALSHITVASLKEDIQKNLDALDSKKKQLREAVERIREQSKAVKEVLDKENL